MKDDHLKFTYINGPTALLEMGGLRLLTDPTFDNAGEEYPTNMYTLRKLSGPALSVEVLGRIEAVLLSHDHHFDNLDHKGRALLIRVGTVLTTEAGAERSCPVAERRSAGSKWWRPGDNGDTSTPRAGRRRSWPGHRVCPDFDRISAKCRISFR
jgi:L-ascorbate metabolism protein UlaG (beta-lactamase superfamily)